jgi:hypothetical protein
LLVGAEGAGLPQHGVYEGCLAVVNMGNNGDIAYRLSHRGAFPSSGLAKRAMGLERNTGIRGQRSEDPQSTLSIEKFAAQCVTFYCSSSLKSGLLG